MRSFLETYGVAIFTLVLGLLGMKIKNATTDKVNQTEEIGNDEVYVAATGRPKPPKTAVDQVYCIYYDDGEMTISQNKIEPEAGRTVVNKGFYDRPTGCTQEMTTVRFIGAVMPKTCYQWLSYCSKLTEIKNIENLYVNQVIAMNGMFMYDRQLKSIDLTFFDIPTDVSIKQMFDKCYNNITVKAKSSTIDSIKKANSGYLWVDRCNWEIVK